MPPSLVADILPSPDPGSGDEVGFADGRDERSLPPPRSVGKLIQLSGQTILDNR
jgi:hypothetical protein